jgi:hypothetical protein
MGEWTTIGGKQIISYHKSINAFLVVGLYIILVKDRYFSIYREHIAQLDSILSKWNNSQPIKQDAQLPRGYLLCFSLPLSHDTAKKTAIYLNSDSFSYSSEPHWVLCGL